MRGVSSGVERLSLTHFRSYETFELTVERAPVVIVGDNGFGKTNLLEALSLFSPGRGLRRAATPDLQARGCGDNPWAVAATFFQTETTFELGTGIPEYGASRRTVRLNHESLKTQSELLQHVQVVWWTPQMGHLLTEGTSVRRRFLDRLILGMDPTYAAQVLRYERALKERSQLFKQECREVSWYEGIEQTLAEAGVHMTFLRLKGLEKINRFLGQIDPPFPRGRLALGGELETWVEDGCDIQGLEQRFLEKLDRDRGLHQRLQGTPLGPQRSYLHVYAHDDAPAHTCSTGEQKALMLSILLSLVHHQLAQDSGVVPLLLLDEIAAHLDEKRRSALFAWLLSYDVQVWMTGTTPRLFQECGGKMQFFQLKQKGVVSVIQEGKS